MVIAYHIILSGYGHWLPNDIRGSMSHRVHSERLSAAGPLHYGRKADQPTADALRSFHRTADPQLHFNLLWWDGGTRQAIADAFGEIVRAEEFTCYACAVTRNHAHLLIRKHRWQAEQMSASLRAAARREVIRLRLAPPEHPVFSADSCHIYKSTTNEVGVCVQYIDDNYRKHRLSPASTPWVVPYDNWPFHKT